MESGDMKHSKDNIEQYEFNLGKAHELRCINNGKTTTCGECETCQLNLKLKEVREWFFRLGDFSKKKFMLGLLRRIQSTDLLEQMVSLLQSVVMKDFIYSRMRTQPSLDTDAMTLSADRALNEEDVMQYITSIWDWFVQVPYWSKANFVFGLLQMCDAHLLSLLHAQARMLLVSERKADERSSGTVVCICVYLKICMCTCASKCLFADMQEKERKEEKESLFLLQVLTLFLTTPY